MEAMSLWWASSVNRCPINYLVASLHNLDSKAENSFANLHCKKTDLNLISAYTLGQSLSVRSSYMLAADDVYTCILEDAVRKKERLSILQ